MMVEYIVEQIQKAKGSKPILVAFDGLDTSGKTTLADKVYSSMKKQNLLNHERIQIDKFHNPKSIRIQKGDLSPEGFFYDSFNLPAIFKNVITPLKKGSDTIINGIYDYKAEQEIINSRIKIDNHSVILFDGIFMHRDELFKQWNLSIFLDISFETMLKRAIKRDLFFFGSEENVKKRYMEKYIPGEKIYLNSCKPKERANIVIDNNNFELPVLLKRYDTLAKNSRNYED